MEKVIKAVKKLLSKDDTGHGFEHVEQVYKNAMKICDTEKEADRKIVALAALLHDCDDYKLFGNECAANLTNSRKIMADAKIGKRMQKKVCDILSTIGYSKRMSGIMPQTLEAQIVSDADMLEAMGAIGVIRCLTFALARCNKYGTPLFDKNVWPVTNMSAEEYKEKDRRSDNFINHFFEKMFKLYGLLLTPTGKKEGTRRYEFMIIFLEQFFEEHGCADWKAYLKNYIRRQKTSVSTKATLKRLKESGKKLGRPKGSRSPGKLQKKLETIKKLLDKSVPKSKIAKKMRCSRSTLYRFIDMNIKE